MTAPRDALDPATPSFGGADPAVTQRLSGMAAPASSSFSVSIIADTPDGLSSRDGFPAAGPDDDFGEATTPSLARPQIVVMEERPAGLVDALTACGFHVRVATSGLQAISLTTLHQIVAVVVGPGDAERRRVLTVALRQRHRNIAIIHVLIRVDDAARRAAAIVGASGVLSWPLPSIDDVLAVVPTSASASALASSSFVEPTGELPLLSVDASAVSDDDLATQVRLRAPLASDVFAPPSRPIPAASSRPPARLQADAIDDDDDDDDALATMPRLRTAVAQAQAEPVARTIAADDLPALLAAVPDLVTRLVAGGAFLEALQMHHVRGADQHARAIDDAVQLLTRLHTQLDSTGGDVE